MRKLKNTLYRKSLETIYTAFMRPILEYAKVINELKKVQLEAGRIATGGT